jgi:hypothetical protein
MVDGQKDLAVLTPMTMLRTIDEMIKDNTSTAGGPAVERSDAFTFSYSSLFRLVQTSMP